MTAQAMEKLKFNGKEVDMASEPLASYLSSLTDKPNLFPESSACWRGYVGTWEIVNGKLYLIAFEGYAANFSERKYWQVGLDFIFPNQSKIFAEWFSGEIRIPDGDLLNYVHGGFDSIYELDLFLEFRNGHLIGKRTVDNLLRLANKQLVNKVQTITKKKYCKTKVMYFLKRWYEKSLSRLNPKGFIPQR